MKPKFRLAAACVLLLSLLGVLLPGLLRQRSGTSRTPGGDSARVHPALRPVTNLISSGTIQPASSPPTASSRTPAKPIRWNDRWWTAPIDEPVFAAFADWCRSYVAATSPAEKAALEAQGIALARQRRSALAEMIESDPRRALELAVPVGLRRALPAGIVSLLEERVSGRGSLAVLGALPEHGKESAVTPTVRVAKVSGNSYDAFVYGRKLGQPTRWDVPIQGVAVEQFLAVDENALRVLEPEETEDFAALANEAVCSVSGEASSINNAATPVELEGQVIFLCSTNHVQELNNKIVAAEGDSTPTGGFAPDDPQASAWTEGQKRLLVIRVDFSDLVGVSLTDSGATNLVNGLDSFHREMSFGRTSFARVGAGSDYTPVFRMPQRASYYGTNNYYDALRSAARSAATAAGYTLGDYDLDLICFGAVPGWGWAGLGYIGASGVWLRNNFSTGVAAHELGHNFGLNHANYWDTSGQSVIGAGTSSEYGDSFDTMGSASGGNNHFNTRYKSYLNWLTTADVQTVSSSGTYRVVAHDHTNATGIRALTVARNASTNYWIEFRQKFTSNKWLMSGAGLRRAQSGNQRSELLDTTPGSSDTKNDSAIVIGRTFSDKEAGIHVTPIGKGGTSPESLDVVINLGTFPGNVDPSVTVTASATAVAVNTAVNFTTSASDANGDSLAYYWDFGDGNFGTNGPAASKSWSSAGDYVVQCIATDMKGGVARDSVIVRVGSPTTYRISGTVTADGYPLHGVRVSVSSTRMTWSDSDGTFNLVGLPAGTYTVSASLDGYTFTNTGTLNPIVVGPNAAGMDFVSGSSDRSVTISSPTNNSTLAAPATLGITANASAGVGRTITLVEFRSGTQKIGEDASAPFAMTWSNTPAGSYSLRAVATDSAGMRMTSAPVAVTVTLQPPSITSQPQSQSVAIGTDAQFTVTAGGSAPLTFRWRLGGTNLAGATNSSLTLASVQAGNAGAYSVVVSNSAGSVTSSVATLTVMVPPAISSQPQSQSVISGVNVTFSVTAAGAAPLSYQWRLNGANVAGNAGRNASYTVSNAQASKAGDYTVVVSNPVGSITSAVAVLTVNAPPQITAQPLSRTVPSGTNVDFSVAAGGASPLSYQWRRDGTPLPGATNATLLLSSVVQTNSAGYSVRVANPIGSVTSVVATLTVTAGTSSNAIRVFSVSLLPTGQARVTVGGNAGETYSIEASSDLVDWTFAGNATNTSGTVVFIDPATNNSVRCFYRARLLP